MHLLLSPLLVLLAAPDTDAPSVQAPAPVGPRGALTLAVDTPRTFRNGAADEDLVQALAELPGVAACYLQRIHEAVYVLFTFAGGETFDHAWVLALPELPGPERYYLQFTWDAERGRSEGYLNGTALRFPGVRFEPWEIPNQTTEVKTTPGPCKVEVVEVLPRFLTAEEMRARIPEEARGRRAELFAFAKEPAPIDVDARRGALLYGRALDEESDVADWVMEGPGLVRFADGAMTMRSETPHPVVQGTGHFNFWCPEDFPASFVAEWEFAPVEEHGCALFFFAAKGAGGEDIFDPTLPRRDGRYPLYTRDAIHNYHTVYFDHLPLFNTAGLTSSLVKANHYTIVSRGPVAVPPGRREFHRLRLVKDGDHIQLTSNGRMCLDYTDPGGDRYGPALGAGKMALRQMAVTVGKYRNLKVWDLPAKE